MLPSQYSFLPGQWVDLHIPDVPQIGGFTITSTPREAGVVANGLVQNGGYLELAIQKSPRNPPAAWLWRPAADIIGSKLGVRIGGSFVWPPSIALVTKIRRLVLIAGGVGLK